MEFNFTINYKLFSRLLFLISPTLLFLKSLEKFKCFWKKVYLYNDLIQVCIVNDLKLGLKKSYFKTCFLYLHTQLFLKLFKIYHRGFLLKWLLVFFILGFFLKKKIYKKPCTLAEFLTSMREMNANGNSNDTKVPDLHIWSRCKQSS